MSDVDLLDNGMVVDTRHESDEIRNTYIEWLAEGARLRNGHLWVSQPSQECISAVREMWKIVAPGWVLPEHGFDRDESIAGMIAHSSISRHLAMVWAVVLYPRGAQVLRALRGRQSRGASPAIPLAEILLILDDAGLVDA